MLGEIKGGRYRIIQSLSAGGFGHTYVVEDLQRPGHPQCVLKQFRFTSPDPTLLQQAQRMFGQEAETLEKLGRHDRIPQLLAYFEEGGEFYLIQELITGQPLTAEITHGRRLSEAQVVDLLQDVLETLVFVHDHGVIHRDLKPDNLMRRSTDDRLVLIDFGAVKTQDAFQTPVGITQPPTLSQFSPSQPDMSQPSIPVYTSGYAASEQCLGRPQYSSDLYALGMIAIQALTGQHPAHFPSDAQTGELIWHDRVQVSAGLRDLLDQLTRFHVRDRYHSAREALQALGHVQSREEDQTAMPRSQLSRSQLSRSQLQPQALDVSDRGTGGISTQLDHNSPTRLQHRRLPWRTITGVGAVTGAGVATTVFLGWPQAWFARLQVQPSLAPTNPALQEQIAKRVSRGDQLLFSQDVPSAKVEAVAHLKRGNVAAAIGGLDKARQQAPADPETLIYLNNARVGATPAYTIAAVAPIGSNPQSAQELLRGVAQAQWQLNQSGGLGGKPLKVTIADDQNQADTAQQIAQYLVADPNILGVVGHGTSDTSLATVEVYQQASMVAISPLSSAVQLSGISRYFFRTMPSDRLPAKQLSEYLLNQLKKRKVAIAYNSNSKYSQSLKAEIKNSLFYGGRGEVVAEINFNQPDFNSVEAIALMAQKQAEVLILANSSDASDRALLLLQANQNRIPLLAGDAMYSNKTLQMGGKNAQGMVVAVPTQQVGLEKSNFQTQANRLWRRDATWRSALAYDATIALSRAIVQAPTRQGIQNVLANPQFTAMGSTRPVQFLPTGDPQGAIQLVQVWPKRGGQGYEFRSLQRDTARSASR
ncbi:bifunctional serine/threonine-protein kinase/ABC transporter substrate-binding protein [Alkalinema sp. FACHB-956]|uniref:bifunctional serine/threonine-protein kinase/ABC transporter substrate-binding protein n=1 Tax=Alkalinema sp. FACHB-956 TaxID=2692768 RepID=UPI001689BE99|nr:bifunctional serine/threonine-protein kinase/ABC transporter substrate-binding protein [Alkalinema sp. FACHB-956]MBD2330028.1 ABC transporter substrate-binding protein [Alkalinema sp. FACHB-956]